jgi:hypothetical protein
VTPLSRLTLGPTACLPIGRKKLYLPRPIDLGGRDTVPPAASGQWASPATVLGVFRPAAAQPFCKRAAEPALSWPQSPKDQDFGTYSARIALNYEPTIEREKQTGRTTDHLDAKEIMRVSVGVCAWLGMQSSCGDYAWTGLEKPGRLRTLPSWLPAIVEPPPKLRLFAGHLC